jgi:lycopene cyclase domain-containing protein
MNNLYLYIDLLTISAPLLLSFDKKVAFYKNWKYLFPAIFIMGVFFIAKDAIFAAYEIWGFNDKYLIGFRMLGLPIEEWLVFPCRALCCRIYLCLFDRISENRSFDQNSQTIFLCAERSAVYRRFDFLRSSLYLGHFCCNRAAAFIQSAKTPALA